MIGIENKNVLIGLSSGSDSIDLERTGGHPCQKDKCVSEPIALGEI